VARGVKDAAAGGDLLARVEQATRTDPARALAIVEKALQASGVSRLKAGTAERARLFRYRAHARRALNDFAGALGDYRRALLLFRRLGDSFEAAVTQIGRLNALMYRGRYQEALDSAAEARRVFVAKKDSLRVARLDMNTGNVYHRWDRPADALRYYDRSRRTFVRLRDRAAQALVDLNRGNVLAGLARYDEAEAAYRSARSIFSSLDQGLMTAEADYGIAYLLFLQERLTEALAAFDQLRPSLEALSERRLLALCDMDASEVLLRLNLWVDAGHRSEKAAAAFRSLDMRYEEARSLAFGGVAFMKTGRHDQALAKWRRAGRLFEKEGNRTWQGMIFLQVGRLERTRGRLGAARRLAETACLHLAAPAPPDRRAEALAFRGTVEAQMNGSRPARRKARKTLLAARRLSASCGATWLVRDCEEELGFLATRDDSTTAARRHFQAAVEAGERLRSLVRGDHFRAAFFSDRTRPYVALASLELSGGNMEEAWRWVERGRSRALLEGLDDLPRRRRGNDQDGRTSRELEAILRRLSAQYHRESVPASGARPSVEVSRLPDTVRRHLEGRAEDLIGHIYPECGPVPASRSPRGAAEPFEATLGSHEALVSYCEIDGAITAFVRTPEGLSVASDLAGALDVSRAADRLGYQWGRFRLGRDVLDRHGRLLLADAIEDLRLLHGLLVAPLSGLRSASSWIVIPSRSMASLPFAAFHDGARHLVETRTITMAPAAGVFARCRSRLDRKPRGSLVVGQTGPTTPEVEGEVAAICRSTPFRPVRQLVGPDATVETVLREAGGRAFIHLASHGFFHAERPYLSGIRLADRWLHAHDTEQAELSAELVVLSACQSGTSLVLEGDEWLGLPRAFLRAGAARVMASLWDVDDRATRELMTRFSAALGRDRKMSPSRALQESQTEILGLRKHPYFWAGFQIVGTP
jgi:tetratricopeptide (TPR) repeat protein